MNRILKTSRSCHPVSYAEPLAGGRIEQVQLRGVERQPDRLADAHVTRGRHDRLERPLADPDVDDLLAAHRLDHVDLATGVRRLWRADRQVLRTNPERHLVGRRR